MGVLSELEPIPVFHFFEEICSIPRGSGNTKAISDYLVKFAEDRNLRYRQEECNNVIIWKEGTPGYEKSPTVMIQGHMDMVCEKNLDCAKNMETEGLDLFVEGDTIGARGTTLGGDDGIALAMALAILDSDEIPHGPLECVFTVDEEIGLLGAQALDGSDLKAKYLLNLDSEEEKVLTVSCAGSARTTCTINVTREAWEGQLLEIDISGLLGGHSGEEIHLGRANSNILMGRTLNEIRKATDMRLITVSGGSKNNAISREAKAIVVVKDAVKAALAVQDIQQMVSGEYATADKGISIRINSVSDVPKLLPMDESSTDKVICVLFVSPNGIQNMSMDVPGLVQTSLNLGVVLTDEVHTEFQYMLRSSVNSQNREVLNKLETLFGSLGGKVDLISSYSAWEYQPNSRLRETITEAFRYVYGIEPKVAALHAGLECGIISGKVPGLDCISYGPDLKEIHTPRERLYIGSTNRTWVLTLETLKRLK